MLWAVAEDQVAPLDPLGLHFLLHDNIHDCSVTFLHGDDGHLYLCSSLDPANCTAQAKLNILCIVIEEILLE